MIHIRTSNSLDYNYIYEYTYHPPIYGDLGDDVWHCFTHIIYITIYRKSISIEYITIIIYIYGLEYIYFYICVYLKKHTYYI